MAVSDNFNRADGPLGANWTDQVDVLAIAGNDVSGGDAGYSAAFWSAHVFEDVQSSQITKVGAGTFVAAGVRMSALAGAANWYAYYDDGSVEKSVGGAKSTIASRASYTAADIAKIAASGSALTVSKNGVPDTVVVDEALQTGSAGIVFFDTGGTLDDWVGTGEIDTERRFLLVRH